MLGAVCALTFITSVDARAQSGSEVETISREVRYADLDLNSEAGSAALLARLHAASERVCGYDSDRRNWEARRHARLCARQAMSRAVSSLDSATVSATYAAWRTNDGARLFSRTIDVAADGASARVQYGDLNLASVSGQNALQRRVVRATRRICGDSTHGVRASQQQRACVESASEDARVQIASLTARHQMAQADTAAPQTSEAPAMLQPASARVAAETPTVQTLSAATTPVAADGYGVCAARAHVAAFEGRSISLNRAQSQEIGYAVDRASVCQIERVTINADRNNALAMRRAAILRASLIGRGVPASLVSVAAVDDRTADGARAEFQFAGVAQNAAPVEMAEAGA